MKNTQQLTVIGNLKHINFKIYYMKSFQYISILLSAFLIMACGETVNKSENATVKVEENGIEISSFIGEYDKVLVSSGLSKAYALPGLRLGWLAGDKDMIANCWSYHDYTSITSGILSQKIGEYALGTEIRKKILDRNRNLLRSNLEIMQKWVDQWDGRFGFVPPKAGGMAYLSYDMDINSSLLSERLRNEFGVFIAAGDWFGMDGYIRIGIGSEKTYFEEGLDVLTKGIKQICKL